jgi:hypothetical protein
MESPSSELAECDILEAVYGWKRRLREDGEKLDGMDGQLAVLVLRWSSVSRGVWPKAAIDNHRIY